MHEEIELCHPAWLVERWKRNARRGRGDRRSDAARTSSVRETWLRLNVQFDLDETVERLEAEDVATAPGEFPWTRRLVSGRPERTEAWGEGRVRIQDVGSQAFAPLLGLEPGMTFLDLCAAPGGKTQHAIETLGSETGVVACDLHRSRFRTIRALGVRCSLAAVDAARPLPFLRTFDRVLVDAPCSGTGTLSRNPDLKWRVQPRDIPRLAKLQSKILRNALDTVASGGVLVYATCSLEPEENEGVVEAVLREMPGWSVEERLVRTPGRNPGDGFRGFRLAKPS